MPLKLNVGLCKKVGEPNYGSRGAAVNVELELDSTLVTEPGKLQEKIRQMFGLVRTSLNEELHGNALASGANTTSNGSQGNDTDRGNGQGTTTTRRATQSQAKAIYAIAKNNRVDVEKYLRDRHGISRPEDLDIKTASQVIDDLKADKEGRR